MSATEQSPIEILIVCHGNTCRSPMAEFLLKHKIEKAGSGHRIHVQSAGINDTAGQIMSQNTHLVLEDNNIAHDKDRHSQRFSDIALEKIDYIFVMTRAIRTDLEAQLSDVDQNKLRLFLSKEDIDDPFGKDIASYEEAFQKIDEGAAIILKHLA